MDTRISRCITHFGTVYGFLLRNLVTHDREKRQVDAINLNVPTDICSKVVVCGRGQSGGDKREDVEGHKKDV